MKTQRFIPAVAWLALAVLANHLQIGAASAQTFTTLKSFGIFTNITGILPVSELVQGPDGILYGTAMEGEDIVRGTVFKVQPDGGGFTVLKWFTNSVEGLNPYSTLTLSGTALYGAFGGGVFKMNTDGSGFTVLKRFDETTEDPSTGTYTNSDGSGSSGLTLSGSTLYGTTSSGGNSGYGTVFKLKTDGTGYTVLKHFAGSDGMGSSAGVTLSGGVLYGTTQAGGDFNAGTVFKMNADGTGYAVLKNFSLNTYDPSTGAFTNSDGVSPRAGVTLSGTTLYGTTGSGGSSGKGTVFKLNTDGTGYTVLKHFSATSYNSSTGSFTNSHGATPFGGVTVSGSVLYGTTHDGGNVGYGTIFKVNTDGTGYTLLNNFANANGANPYAGVTLSDSVLFGTTYTGGNSGYGTVFKVNTNGTGYTVLKNFNPYTDGVGPYGRLALSGGVLYGTTESGGNSGSDGMVFQVNTDTTGYAVVKHFGITRDDPSTGARTNSDGARTYVGLTLSDSVLYGSTPAGGSLGWGTVFRFNNDGTGFTVLKNFAYSDGRYPSSLTLSGDTFYGTMEVGGSSGYGIVFKLNTDGTGYTALKNFTGNDGAEPSGIGGLTLSGSALYGATSYGGSSDNGTVFKLNTDGTGYTVLKHFAGTDGANPYCGLVLSGSTLYGTTPSGGSSGYGTVFKLNTNGTGFAVLKHFTGSDGSYPSALVLSGSMLYGATASGGDGLGYGTVFRMKTNGTGHTVLKHFAAFSDGVYPTSLILSGSTLYGTTQGGGTGLGYGTVFKIELSIPLIAQALGNAFVLSWSDPSFALQAAPSVAGIYTNIPGATSPYTNAVSGPQRFFRLIGN